MAFTAIRPDFGLLRARGVAVKDAQAFFEALRFGSGFVGFVGIICAKEICVADEEVFFVVVGVDEPAGDTFNAIAANRMLEKFVGHLVVVLDLTQWQMVSRRQRMGNRQEYIDLREVISVVDAKRHFLYVAVRQTAFCGR
ncbi:MAG: hypothetical protein M0P59_06205 [Gallionella sp.]|jgi:hypothetical protein|nr:hypothetical protein [Gallionella sp.]MCK9353735.1 hypothetical protein [Gallionella sp.]